MGADLVMRTIYQGCCALPFALAGLSCIYYVHDAPPKSCNGYVWMEVMIEEIRTGPISSVDRVLVQVY